ncbi:LAME_0A02872g1_1 [Lachancea meyersii CBS 8951]|uniref:LAME_0A02872g1_1 n=1 Tax=Lachancea meyersii CBS 8951 TaxID=1266667 RepID=A0A1G4IN11_9SACH|nr:LAME_0A02872g1_1 [Lachancea meyersii CBS 8951]
MGRSLTCLIVGETPATQFLAWRLSLSNAFIILASSNISSDGLVSWKSSKLGSNFYRPNVFAKEFEDLESKLAETDGSAKYKIDVMVVSCLSFPSLDRYCKLLSKYSDKNTVVLMNANFGVELESLVLDMFFNCSSCVLSILCDVEARQLSSGSYALVNDSCCFYVGLTNIRKDVTNRSSKHDKHDNCRLNIDRVKEIMADEGSILNAVLAQVQQTEVEEIIKIGPDRSFEMAVKVWEHLIPRISLNILSIVFEQFDYDKLLANSSSRLIFEDLVTELMQICYKQCGSVVMKYMKASFDASKDSENIVTGIDFEKVVQETKDRKRQMDMFTINEYPEFLTLSFEAYCFHHRLEYPAHVLLHQPMRLANEFGMNYSSLNFLFGFYSQLLLICGYRIEGGPNKLGRSSLLFGAGTQLVSPSEQTLVPKDNTSPSRSRINVLRDKLKRKVKQEHSLASSCDESESPVNRVGVEQIYNESDDGCVNELYGVEGSSASSPKNPGFQIFCGGNMAEDSGPEEICDSTSVVDDMVQLPKFRGRNEVDADAVFEQELRANPLTMSSRYYFDAYRLGDQTNFRSLDEKRSQHWNRSKLWKLQRQYLAETGQVANSTLAVSATVPDRFLWDHVNLLRQVNMGGILSVTTSRYGHVDTSQRLFDDWSRGVGPIARLTLTAPPTARAQNPSERRSQEPPRLGNRSAGNLHVSDVD